MQTFLPYDDFAESARVLDRQRLGKQRVEVLQLLGALLNDGKAGWANHPAARMWRGHEGLLAYYGIVICNEWISRGYRDTCRGKISAFEPLCSIRTFDPPPWLGDEAFHASHRSNLLRKDAEWYGQFGWQEPDDLPYVWPVAAEEVGP